MLPSTRFSGAVAAAVMTVACGDGGYEVVVAFEPETLAADAERVELALVPDCARQPPGEPAADAVLRLSVTRADAAMRLGDAEPGSYGLYARGLSAACRAIAAGCTDVELEAGGSGELTVTLTPLDGPGCTPGTICGPGASCVTGQLDAATPDAATGDAAMLDAGTPDAGAEGGGPDGGLDGGPPDGCVVAAETCNGGDEDCDGRIDETFDCTTGAVRGCSLSCAEPGQQTCGTACTWDACTHDPDPQDIALYTFDAESTATAFADAIGTHAGAVTGGMVSWTAGPLGCGDAMAFPATAGVYGEVPDSPDWDLTQGRVELWARFVADGRQVGVISRDGSGTTFPGHLTLYRQATGTIRVRLQNTTAEAQRCTAAPVAAGVWTDISIRFGVTDLELVVDGVPAVPAGTCTGSITTGIDGNDNPWVFGASTHGSAEGSATPTSVPFLNGAIDHVRIRNRRASATAPEVTGFVLVNADTDTNLGPLGEGDVLDLAALPTSNLNVRANTDPGDVGSVVFDLDGTSAYSTETSAPYALAGDTGMDYDPWTPAAGAHTLTATAYTGAGGTGTAGPPRTIRFTVR